MNTITVTAQGQVTFRKEVLQHLGVNPGDKIELELLSDGSAQLINSKRQTGTLDGFLGVLAGKSKKVAALKEINEAVAAGWAGEI